MDTRLRELYRAYGGNDWRYLMACLRAGGIPPGSSIALDQLPETAKHTDLGQARPAYMVEHELDYSMHLGLVGASPLGNIVTRYILESDSWTLFGSTRSDLSRMFMDRASHFRFEWLDELLMAVESDEDGWVDQILFDESLTIDTEGFRLHRLYWNGSNRVSAIVRVPIDVQGIEMIAYIFMSVVYIAMRDGNYMKPYVHISAITTDPNIEHHRWASLDRIALV